MSIKEIILNAGKKIIIQGATQIAKIEVDTTCPFISYQEALPKSLKEIYENENENI